MCINDEKNEIAYFCRPGFERLLELIWKKYASLERAGGKVVLSRLVAEECEAINGFFGWFKKPGETVEVPLKLFEVELQVSPFPSTIPDLHLALAGTPLLTRSERTLQREEKWQHLFRHRLIDGENCGEASEITRWIEGLKTGKAAGYRTLRDLYRTSPQAAQRVLEQVTKALFALRSGRAFFRFPAGVVRLATVRLPVLAAHVTGNSHAFDWKETAGRLLWYGISEIWGKAAEWTALDESDWGSFLDIAPDAWIIREVYRLAGVGDDDVSSQVLGYTADLSQDVEPTVLTLRQVEQMQDVPSCSSLYVVENPAVFSTLLDITQKVKEQVNGHGNDSATPPVPVLICTNGQPSVAAVRLMERLLQRAGKSGRLFYSGDFDVSGLHMALALAKRFTPAFLPWRMGTDTYRQWSDRGPVFTRGERERLRKLRPAWDECLADTMARTGRKCFQETFVTDLAADWLAIMPTGATAKGWTEQ